MNIIERLKEIIRSAAEEVAGELGVSDMPDILLEAPKDKKLADLSSNVAMQLCKGKKGLRPLEIADRICCIANAGIKKEGVDADIRCIEAKPPGFINIHFSESYLQAVLEDISANGQEFGSSSIGNGRKALLEFVSANPTGPLSVAHGRQAAVGDAIANILEFAGYKVQREYYLNDEGNQIVVLGKSIHARYCELIGEMQPFPEDGYRGDYIYDIAKKIIENHGKSLITLDKKSLELFCDFGIKYIMDLIKQDLDDFQIRFDNYFSQRKLSEAGSVEKALEKLKEKGVIYEKDNALWFGSSCFGDDKDRVLRKSDSSYTYITPDIAYHEDKFRRGFDWLIDLWGPDHHGYIPRLKAASRAMGRDDNALSLLIIQLVTLSRAGKPVPMSTRSGEFITLREVMDEVGKDVAKFFFLIRRKDSHLDFDLELAKKESMENPIYYIQYAHARICGILEYKEKLQFAHREANDLKLLNTEEELSVLRMLREFPDTIEWSAQNLEPHILLLYLMDMASSFHSFYTKCRVVSEDKRLSSARLFLVECLKTVFSKSLALLGITCPEKM
ncbi:MAG: arginine--tRNA ligase [Candidatus Omnitrophota bacterium]